MVHPYLLFPKISIKQYNCAFAGIPFLIMVDKIIVFPISGSCTVRLPFTAVSSRRLCCCVSCRRRRWVSHAALSAPLSGRVALPPLSFHVASERKCLQWQTEIRHFLIVMKKEVSELPGVRQAPQWVQASLRPSSSMCLFQLYFPLPVSLLSGMWTQRKWKLFINEARAEMLTCAVTVAGLHERTDGWGCGALLHPWHLYPLHPLCATTLSWSLEGSRQERRWG